MFRKRKCGENQGDFRKQIWALMSYCTSSDFPFVVGNSCGCCSENMLEGRMSRAVFWCLGCVCRWSWAALSTQLWLGLCSTVCTVCHSLTLSCCLDVWQCRHTCRQIGLLKIHFTNHPFQLSGWEQSFCPAAPDNENPISDKWNFILFCLPGKLLTCALCPRCSAHHCVQPEA